MHKLVQALFMQCERCGFESLRFALPKRCPRCKSPYWDKPRQVRKEGL